MQQLEFSREVVAVLVSAIIASVIDPVDASPARRSQSPQPFDEDSPGAQATERRETTGDERLAALLSHYDFRFDQLAELGMPDSLRGQYEDVRWMLLTIMEYQRRLAGVRGSAH